MNQYRSFKDQYWLVKRENAKSRKAIRKVMDWNLTLATMKMRMLKQITMKKISRIR